MTRNKGEFNLDYEETILVLGKYGKLKKSLKTILKLAERLLVLLIGKYGVGSEEELIAREIKNQASSVVGIDEEE